MEKTIFPTKKKQMINWLLKNTLKYLDIAECHQERT
jgi:hypothetical protein